MSENPANQPPKDAPKQPAPLKPAATFVLLRQGGAGIECFMVKRRDDMEFAGALVFPGGMVDPGDADPALHARCTGGAGLDADMKALVLAGLREAFEEAGLLLARRGNGAAITAAEVDALAAERRALALGELSIAALAARENLVFDLDGVAYFSRWQTPRRQPRRYDTFFFAAAAPEGQLGAHDHESVDSLWITPADAIEANTSGRYTVLPPTRMNLLKIGRHASVDVALDTFRREPVFTVEPVPDLEAPEGPVIRIPAEAGYGVTAVPVRIGAMKFKSGPPI
jgi:8-oxo-dGTP pyrophosphatase MutT (NUDIX family)